MIGGAASTEDLFKAQFDYIWYTPERLGLVGVRGLIGDGDGSAQQPMPNDKEPSDHHLLHGIFKLR